MTSDRLRTPRAWDTAWQGTPSWETGRPQPVVERLLAEGAFSGARVLDAGCGSGRHAVLIAATGAPVVGVDVAPGAVERARAHALAQARATDGRAGPLDVRFVVGDALDLPSLEPALGGPFDAVLDVGLFHVLQPDDAPAYARALAAVTREGGRAHVVAWSDRNPFGIGPGRIRRAALRAAFTQETGWRIESIADAELETTLPMAVVHAWLARIVRR